MPCHTRYARGPRFRLPELTRAPTARRYGPIRPLSGLITASLRLGMAVGLLQEHGLLYGLFDRAFRTEPSPYYSAVYTLLSPRAFAIACPTRSSPLNVLLSQPKVQTPHWAIVPADAIPQAFGSTDRAPGAA
jgi:hypothetical protein